MPSRLASSGLVFTALLALRLAAAESGEVVFRDDFASKLGEGWSWVREESANWRVGPGGLEVRVQPGNMWGGANNARNVLVRAIPLPDPQPIEISVTFSNTPTARWEQANLVWFYDDSNMVKLGEELVADRLTIVMGREESDRARTIAIIPLDDFTVSLRLQASGNKIRGQYRTLHRPIWQDVGECDLPVKGAPKASLHFYNGSPQMEHWVKVNDFTVRRLPASAANWPRTVAAEKRLRSTGEDLPAREAQSLPLKNGFALVNLPGGLAEPGAKPNFDQAIFTFNDGACGWGWDRRGSARKEPATPGIEFKPAEFPLTLTSLRTFAVELDAVPRINIDRPDHTFAMVVDLASSAAPDAPAGPQLALWFDWYGKDWTAPSISDGQRDYAFDAAASSANRWLYRCQGLRGVPPQVNLKPLLDDAVKRAGLNPAQIWIRRLWVGSEVVNGSDGATLVTRLECQVNDRRHPGVPWK